MIGSSQPKLEIPDLDDDLLDFEDEDEDAEEDKSLDMPATWVSAIEVTAKQFESR